jgi:hypothetical protein
MAWAAREMDLCCFVAVPRPWVSGEQAFYIVFLLQALAFYVAASNAPLQAGRGLSCSKHSTSTNACIPVDFTGMLDTFGKVDAIS